MKKKKTFEDQAGLFDDYLGCFGEFSMEDQVCLKLCALSLRCAIEREQNSRMELLEDLLATDTVSMRMQ